MKTKFEIKTFGGKILFELETESLKRCVEEAVELDADLRDADLRGADLGDADLRGADLGGAYLGGANLRDANLRGADLRDADLGGAYLLDADLRGADLGDADLRGAKNLDTAYIETGETWRQYLTETVPALLVAGGKTIEEVAVGWDCHSWDNCPMAIAFGVHTHEDVPVLFRPRAEQFVMFFDSGLIPRPEPSR